MCKECGHVQILDIIDSSTLWDDYTYHSGQTKGIIKHFEEIAETVFEKYKLSKKNLVIDIGSNDGSLLRPFKNMGCNVLGVDPAWVIANEATESGIETIPEILTMELAKRIRKNYGSASLITAFNVFAHTDDMNQIADSIKHLLAKDGIFIFEAQYLLDIIDKFLVGTIFHEHMSHHSLKPLSRFLRVHGMEIINVEKNNIQHGSIVGTVQLRNGPRRKHSNVGNMITIEDSRKLDKPEVFSPFIKKLETMKRFFFELTHEWMENNSVVAGFGAARSGPTLIAQYNLGKIIQYIFDDHPQKVYKYSPGDKIPIIPTVELLKRRPNYTIILAWIHGQKIIKKNKEYLEKGGKFVLCYPDARIIDSVSDI
jgi:2-polyprenyl-3-methyl-5-hydroxy-6-metoxy-1,4-benzoquinol methylase|tara:strand:+ start:248 stop:1351 length:1104 start_codon:yes stop_codon:yes gene_type:complete